MCVYTSKIQLTFFQIYASEIMYIYIYICIHMYAYISNLHSHGWGKSRCVAGVLVLTMAALLFFHVFFCVWQDWREKVHVWLGLSPSMVTFLQRYFLWMTMLTAHVKIYLHMCRYRWPAEREKERDREREIYIYSVYAYMRTRKYLSTCKCCENSASNLNMAELLPYESVKKVSPMLISWITEPCSCVT